MHGNKHFLPQVLTTRRVGCVSISRVAQLLEGHRFPLSLSVSLSLSSLLMSAAASSSSIPARVLKDIRTILRIKKAFPSFRIPLPTSVSSSSSSTTSSSFSVASTSDISIPGAGGDADNKKMRNLRHELMAVIRMHSDSNVNDEKKEALRAALSSYAELLSRYAVSPYHISSSPLSVSLSPPSSFFIIIVYCKPQRVQVLA